MSSRDAVCHFKTKQMVPIENISNSKTLCKQANICSKNDFSPCTQYSPKDGQIAELNFFRPIKLPKKVSLVPEKQCYLISNRHLVTVKGSLAQVSCSSCCLAVSVLSCVFNCLVVFQLDSPGFDISRSQETKWLPQPETFRARMKLIIAGRTTWPSGYRWLPEVVGPFLYFPIKEPIRALCVEPKRVGSIGSITLLQRSLLH